MNRTILFLAFFTLLGWSDARAQALLPSFTERPAEGWPAETEVIYQPVVQDTTLLFPKPWLVWLCTCDCPVEYEFYYEVDFRKVRTCWGRKEVFDREEVMGVYAFVQRGLGKLYAMLEESEDGFVYKELSHEDSTATAPFGYTSTRPVCCARIRRSWVNGARTTTSRVSRVMWS